MKELNLKDYIADIPDWPKEGIVFKDISPLLANSDAFNHAIASLKGLVDDDITIDAIVGIESRGFLFGTALANSLGCGFIMCRKAGKLPPPAISTSYALEYGEGTLEIKEGTGNVLIVDDLYATGGTMKATRVLCKKAGYTVVKELVLINLSFLHNDTVNSVIEY